VNRTKNKSNAIPLRLSLSQLLSHNSDHVSIDLRTIKPKLAKELAEPKIKIKLPIGLTAGSILKATVETAKGEALTLNFKVYINREDNFKVDGYDLHTTCKISFSDLKSNNNIRVKTPGGEVLLQVHDALKSGDQIKFPGHGLYLKDKSRGALFVTTKLTRDPSSSRSSFKLANLKDLFLPQHLRHHPLHKNQLFYFYSALSLVIALSVIAIMQYNRQQDEVFEALHNTDWRIQVKAVAKIKELESEHEKAIPVLKEMVQNKTNENFLRGFAATTLSQIAPLDLEAALIISETINEDDFFLRKSSVEALSNFTAMNVEIIKRLIPALDDENEQVRIAALNSLNKLGTDSLQPLIDSSINDFTSQHELEPIHEEFDVPDEDLALALADDDPEIRIQASLRIAALEMGNDDISLNSRLIELLNDSDERVASAAAKALGKIKANDSVWALSKRLLDTSENVRYYSAVALNSILNRLEDIKPATDIIQPTTTELAIHYEEVPPRTAEPIQLATSMNFDEIQISALKFNLTPAEAKSPTSLPTIESIELKTALAIHNTEPSFVANLTQPKLSRKSQPSIESEILVSELAELSLTPPNYKLIEPTFEPALQGNIATEPTPIEITKNIVTEEPTIISFIDKSKDIEQDVNTKDLSKLIYSLGNSDYKNRDRIIQQLSLIGENAIPALTAALKDKNVIVRADSAFLIAKLGTRSNNTINSLIETLSDRSPEVRANACWAIGNILKAPNSQAITKLKQLLRDNEFWVRTQAALALGKIGSDEAVHSLKNYSKL
jgi:HEAT repeat protein